MDIALTGEQLAWQEKAREFAQDELKPLSLRQDRIADPKAAFDWDVIRKGSRLGFRTAVVPREWGGHGIDAVTQVLVMKELARGDSAISKTFSQCWKWSHLIASHCSDEQRERFLPPFLADDTYLLGHAGTEPNAGSDHRLPPEDDPKSGWHLRAERSGDEWILNGEKCFMANGGVAKLFFVSTRTNPRRAHPGRRHGVPGADRYAGLARRPDVQQERLALLSERRAHFRECARASCERCREGERRTQDAWRRIR